MFAYDKNHEIYLENNHPSDRDKDEAEVVRGPLNFGMSFLVVFFCPDVKWLLLMCWNIFAVAFVDGIECLYGLRV